MRKLWIFSLLSLFIASCDHCKNNGPDGDNGDLTGTPYLPQAYTIAKPACFPEVPVPVDNPQTVAGVQLGRRLFYDPILSGDSTQSCSSCHLPKGSFTDNLATSKGIDGINGKRSAMSLLNIAYVSPLFWDGRVNTLEEQALRPVEDPIEMHATWPNVVERLKKHPTYPVLFRQAFGITNKSEITKELAAKALSQFERILISSGKSRFDRFYCDKELDVLTPDEENGYKIYFNLDPALPDGQCFHCHNNPALFTQNQFFNNGLDSAPNLTEFADLGRGQFTGVKADNGTFRAPTLRNIEMSAPYMHDGRFKTLEEVIDHYSDNVQPALNLGQFADQLGYPPNFGGLKPKEKAYLLKFLKTLTDTTFVNNPDIQSPF